MKKFILYAAMFGKKVSFKKPTISGLDMDKILYTDLPRLLSEDHVFYNVKETNLDYLDSVRRNRFIKSAFRMRYFTIMNIAYIWIISTQQQSISMTCWVA